MALVLVLSVVLARVVYKFGGYHCMVDRRSDYSCNEGTVCALGRFKRGASKVEMTSRTIVRSVGWNVSFPPSLLPGTISTMSVTVCGYNASDDIFGWRVNHGGWGLCPVVLLQI